MKQLQTIGVVVAVLLILLVTFGFTLAELATITKITSSDQAVGLAVMNGGFYIAIKLIVITLAIYVTSLKLYVEYSIYVLDKKCKGQVKLLKKLLDEQLLKRQKEQDVAKSKQAVESLHNQGSTFDYHKEPVLSSEIADEVFKQDITFDKVDQYQVQDTLNINVQQCISDYPLRTNFVVGNAGDEAWQDAVQEWTKCTPVPVIQNLETMQMYVDRHGKTFDKHYLRNAPESIKKLMKQNYHTICY